MFHAFFLSFSGSSAGKESTCMQCRRPCFDSWVRKIPWKRDRLSSPVFLGFPDGKESACSMGDLGSIPGLGRSPGGGYGNPLQYFYLENSMKRGAWWATVYRIAKSRTRLKRLNMHTHTHTPSDKSSHFIIKTSDTLV